MVHQRSPSSPNPYLEQRYRHGNRLQQITSQSLLRLETIPKRQNGLIPFQNQWNPKNMAYVSQRIQARTQTVYGYLEVKVRFLKSLCKQIDELDQEKK